MRKAWKVVRNKRREKKLRANEGPNENNSGSVGGSSGGVSSGHGLTRKGLTPTVLGKRMKSREPCDCCSVGTLIEMGTDGVNGLNDEAPEWEELEFLIYSGASVTVVGDESVKAVQASDANKGRQYKLADGSYVPH